MRSNDLYDFVLHRHFLSPVFPNYGLDGRHQKNVRSLCHTALPEFSSVPPFPFLFLDSWLKYSDGRPYSTQMVRIVIFLIHNLPTNRTVKLNYFLGIAAIVWYFFWYFLVENDPVDDKCISPAEQAYIISKVNRNREKVIDCEIHYLLDASVCVI